MITSYSSRFQELQDAFVIEKCREYARWTIPYLMGEATRDGKQSSIEGDYQSLGALLVNSLSAKLTGLLFPTTHPFMSIELTSEGREVLQGALQEMGEDPNDLNNHLAVLVRDASNKAFTGKSFYQLTLALKYLIVTGNVGIKRNSGKGSIICYGLNSYVTRRDSEGNVIEAIIRETTYFKTLAPEVQSYLKSSNSFSYNEHTIQDKKVVLYHRIVWEEYYVSVSIGIDDLVLPDDYTTEYEFKKCPYIFPVWSILNGEHYGRGLVEEHKGDHAKLSVIEEALTLYELESLRLLHLVSAESFDAVDELSVAETGEFVRASPNAVSTYEAGATQKVQYISADSERVFERLSKAYMWRGNTRSGERVTAYEIRQNILEVEAAMGGAYSALAEGLQLPLSYVLLYEANPVFTDAMLDLSVGQLSLTTGINALGGTTKANHILEALAEFGSTVEVAQFDRRIDPSKILDILFASKGLDFREISKSPEQLQEEADAEIQAQEAQTDLEEANSAISLGDALAQNQMNQM